MSGAAALRRRLLVDGGATLDAATLTPLGAGRGYVVGLVDGDAASLPATATGREIVDALRRIAAANRAAVVGAWVDGGRIYLDPVEIVDDLRDALDRGRARRQVAVYDLAAGASVATGVER